MSDQHQWTSFTTNHPGTAAQAGQALVNLEDFGLLKISGSDNAKFLQGQITCDIHKAAAMTGRGAHCNPQGRIICLFYLFKRDEDYYLLLPQSTLQISLNTLKKYAVFYKVRLEISEDLFIVGNTGAMPSLEPYLELSVLPITLFRRFIIGKFQPLTEFWRSNVNTHETKNASYWKTLDIQEKRVQIYDKTSAQLLPHEIQLHQTTAIDFAKGCYTGQEIIARMHYKAKLKKGMYRANLHGRSPQLGEPIYVRGKTEPLSVGMVIESCPQDDDQHESLIVIENVYAKDHDIVIV